MDVSTDSAKGHSACKLSKEGQRYQQCEKGKDLPCENCRNVGRKYRAQNGRHTIFDEVRRFGFFEANSQN